MIIDLTDEQIKRLEDYYVSTPGATLSTLAAEAKALIGREVDRSTLKGHSGKRRWGVMKKRFQMGKSSLPESVGEEADDLRTIVYDKIMDPDDPPSVQELTTLIASWQKLQEVAPRTRSAKTPREQAIAAAQKATRNVVRFRKARDQEPPNGAADDNK